MASRAQRLTLSLAVALGLWGVSSTASQSKPVDPESVVVVANKSVPGSVKIARHYLKMRGIPKDHLIILKTGERERLSRKEYLRTIHNPLLQQLIREGLINAIQGEKDSLGRITVTVIANPIRYMVLCYGVPTTVVNMPMTEIDDLALREKRFAGKLVPLGESFKEGPLAKNIASVDGELSLLLKRDVPLNGFVPNPYFRNLKPETVRDILKVTRLDGPTPKAVYRLMENTLAGEKSGLKGRAYVDLDGRRGGYQEGNDWMKRTAGVFDKLGFDLDRDPGRPTFSGDSRFDAPVLYAGWYARHVEGPFTLPGFKFPPGAVAAHLHSSSAQPLRSTDKGWVGPLVDKGACATFGNVAEPYLKFSHHFDLYFAILADGWNVADAAYMALPVLSWQGLVIGDPFYRPFAISLDQQRDSLRDLDSSLGDPYVVLRMMNTLKQNGQQEEALKLARRGMVEFPGPALAIGQALLLEESGKHVAACRILSQFADFVPTESNEWGLYAEIADHLLRLGDAGAALRIYKHLEKVKMPDKVQLAFLKRGIQSAIKAGDTQTSTRWELRVNPPPPPEDDMETPSSTDSSPS